jgi:hypothetical protein
VIIDVVGSDGCHRDVEEMIGYDGKFGVRVEPRVEGRRLDGRFSVARMACLGTEMKL